MAFDRAADDRFGQAVAVYGDTMAVGAYLDDNDNGSDGGSVYLFRSTNAGGSLGFQAKLTIDDGLSTDFFGTSVVFLNRDTLAVGAQGVFDDNGEQAGAVYTFQQSVTSNGWTQQAKIEAPDGARNDFFGERVKFQDPIFHPFTSKLNFREFENLRIVYYKIIKPRG